MENKTGNRNEKVQELEPEMMEQVNGGIGGPGNLVVCSKCREVFRSGDDFVLHIPLCPGKPASQQTVMP